MARPRSFSSRRAAWKWLPAVCLLGGALAIGPVAAGAAGAATVVTHHHGHHRHHGHGPTLYVATTGTDAGNCQSSSSPCLTLGYALGQASANGRILVEPGTYAESANPTGTANVVPPSLRGLTVSSDAAMGGAAGNTIIDATGSANGIVVEANRASVRGLTFENANLEGILVEPPPSTWPTSPTAPAANVWRVTIAYNVVTGNDKSYNSTTHACPTSLTDFDDCGEGLHLLGASSSRVVGNDVSNNVGGVLVSDGGLPPSFTGPTTEATPVGPAAHNVIAYNVAMNNLYDCGFTLPGHDPYAVATTGPSAGMPQPKVAGVYDNLVKDNVSVGNGGAGFLDATPYPGTGSYDNVFARDFASGNGNAGFTMHSHAPMQDVNGIEVVSSVFGPNNLAGDPDAGVTATTGILFLSVAVNVTGTVVAHNRIFDNVNGIARTSTVPLYGIGNNRFFGVGTPYLVYTAPPPGP